MLVFRGTVKNRQAIVDIGLRPIVPRVPAARAEQAALSVPIREYKALIDTGAQRTCLARRIIASEDLRRHSKRFIQNVHSEAVHYLYWAQLGFWANGTTDAAFIQKTYFGLPVQTEIMDIFDNDNFDAIVGMDILIGFDFHLRRSGEFELLMQ